MNQDDFKLDSRNKPRIFSNSIKISNNDESEFNKVYLHFVTIDRRQMSALGNKVIKDAS